MARLLTEESPDFTFPIAGIADEFGADLGPDPTGVGEHPCAAGAASVTWTADHGQSPIPGKRSPRSARIRIKRMATTLADA